MNMINKLALVVLSSLALSFSHSAVAVEYTLKYRTWELISFPEFLPADQDTPAEIFGAAIASVNPAAMYENDWVMWSYDSTADPVWEKAPLNESVQADKGYWIIQAANRNTMADITVELNTVSGPVYEIGDTGPAGGFVFYVTEDGLHGLEAAPADQGSAPWGCSDSWLVGGTHTSLGSGKLNTQLIVNQCGEGTAAALANNYAGGGYIDWYLPSKGELSLMYKNLAELGAGGFAADIYWSSSEFDSFNAWFQNFFDGFQLVSDKGFSLRVRAVRAF